MIETVRRRRFDTRAVRWDGTNEAEVRELCPGFRAIPEEDRGDDSDATGECNQVPIFTGDWIVAWPGGRWRLYLPAEYVAEFEPVTA
jgi:hypothetical protein